MNVLVIGNGGRERALAWKLAPNRRATRGFVAPGNAGTAVDAVNVNLSAGMLRESLTLDVAGDPPQACVVALYGNVPADLTVTPSSLLFLSVTPGTRPTRTLQVATHPRRRPAVQAAARTRLRQGSVPL